MENNDPEKKAEAPTPAPDSSPTAGNPPATKPASVSNGPTFNPTELTKEAKQFGMLCHITGLAGLLTVGFGNWIGPLVVWLLKKEEHPFVDDQGKEALNFQITCLIGYLIGWFTVWIFFIGFLIMFAVAVLWLIYTIIAAVQASEGVTYRYPFSIRLIK
jgi:uncharacterized Tic20 family protein